MKSCLSSRSTIHSKIICLEENLEKTKIKLDVRIEPEKIKIRINKRTNHKVILPVELEH